MRMGLVNCAYADSRLRDRKAWVLRDLGSPLIHSLIERKIPTAAEET